MRRVALLAVVGAVVLFYSSPAPAQSNSSSLGTAAVPGTTIKVNTKVDEKNTDGDCSLREAIKAANTNKVVDECAAGSATDRDAIHFALGERATITLGSTLPAITNPSGLTIDGQKNKITVSGNDKVRVFRVNRGGKFSLLHLTVANARNSGLFNHVGQVKVSNSTFSGNHAYSGGGISNVGTLTVINSTFSGNSANAEGGGIANGGKLTVINSTFSRNSANQSAGGGILNGGTLTVSNSTFSGNHADFDGGGIENFHGTATVSNSTFFGNSANYFGGGMFNDQGTLKVSNSTFSGNSGGLGGGIENFGKLTVINSTFSGNSARRNGGGIANFETATVINSTISGNSAKRSGGGISNDYKVTLKNTIVANSTNGKNCSGRKIIDGGYNLEDSTSCSFSSANHSLPSTEPKLARSLANNGGTTLTIALLTGSPAINAIPQATNGCGTKIRTDQRGVKRPQGNRCDIGAFEKTQ